MTETTQLIATLKRQLRQQGKTYKDVASLLNLSEPAVKRLFTSTRFPLDRIVHIANMLGFTLAELTQEAASNGSRLHTLTDAQEKELVSDPQLLLVAVCALNQWTLSDILSRYQLTEVNCVTLLLRLDKLQLIHLLPGNRIRLNVSRDFDWRPNGWIRQYFQQQGLSDFLDSGFLGSQESCQFAHAMLTDAAIQKMQLKLLQIRNKFAELHQESLSSPLPKRRGSALLLAMREWEPVEFVSLRRYEDLK
ncbi:helix-turn-helix domain-containing protein [Undibacterium sp. RuTC16W]|uniref:helix-turn-helix domain-containing protein n=1 Tax=Undibacterium sp. RuTC16W TaxID=3413048 RepID=UPI003BF3B5F7